MCGIVAPIIGGIISLAGTMMAASQQSQAAQSQAAYAQYNAAVQQQKAELDRAYAERSITNQLAYAEVDAANKQSQLQQQSDTQLETANYNAQLREEERQKRLRAIRGSQTALFGASGFDPLTGSALDVGLSTAADAASEQVSDDYYTRLQRQSIYDIRTNTANQITGQLGALHSTAAQRLAYNSANTDLNIQGLNASADFSQAMADFNSSNYRTNALYSGIGTVFQTGVRVANLFPTWGSNSGGTA